MAETLTYLETLTITHCGVCGIKHAIPSELYNKAKDYGESWCCPKGHNLVFVTTEKEKLENKIASLERSLTYKQSRLDETFTDLVKSRNEARAQKAAKTRLKNRVKHGVCPCCNRTFKQLTEHMKTTHPDYISES